MVFSGYMLIHGLAGHMVVLLLVFIVIYLFIFKLVSEKAEELEVKWPTSAGSLKKQENSRKTSILSSVKQISSPGWMHETSAWGWCTGKTQRDGMGKEVRGNIGMGNTCKSMADSCQCMAKTTTIL